MSTVEKKIETIIKACAIGLNPELVDELEIAFKAVAKTAREEALDEMNQSLRIVEAAPEYNAHVQLGVSIAKDQMTALLQSLK